MKVKMDFNKVRNKIENIANKVDIIMRNRLIIAIFLIVDGINFILKPNSSMHDMARSVALFVFLASGTLLITNITSSKKDKKSIIMSIIIIAMCISFYIFPTVISIYLKLILAFLIIFNGVINILNCLKLDKVSAFITEKENTIKNIVHKKELNKDFENGINEQTEKLMNPLDNVINKTSKKTWIYVIVNIISIILGVLLLIKPDVTMVVWGVIFIYTGLSDFIMVAKSMNISKKIKEKDFESILYDEEAKPTNVKENDEANLKR